MNIVYMLDSSKSMSKSSRLGGLVSTDVVSIKIELINEFCVENQFIYGIQNIFEFMIFRFHSSFSTSSYANKNKTFSRFQILPYYIKGLQHVEAKTTSRSTAFLYIFVTVKVRKMNWVLRRLLQTTQSSIPTLKEHFLAGKNKNNNFVIFCLN